MGAHPKAPSRVYRGGAWHSLLDVIRAEPETELGARVLSKFGPALPFLFKVLAAETPLSLQAHPNLEQARAGFEADELASIALDAAHRNYKDPNHKPELLCALGPFEAFSGFRRVTDTVRLLRSLQIEQLAPRVAKLEEQPNPSGLRELFSWLMATEGAARSELVAATLAACERHRDERGAFAYECDWVLRIGSIYQRDIGVTVALLLNLVRLDAGQGMYLPAGNLHAYLKGVALEIMANSDNVLRGGLTPKHVNVPELVRVLTFADGPVLLLSPQGTGPEQIYDTPASEFRLSRIELGPAPSFRVADRRGPEILLCVNGVVTVRETDGSAHALSKGSSIFIAASSGPYDIAGAGALFRAAVGDF
jgi:mannose-6-phosphate isomerase